MSAKHLSAAFALGLTIGAAATALAVRFNYSIWTTPTGATVLVAQGAENGLCAAKPLAPWPTEAEKIQKMKEGAK